jgi:SynChlorMet cassette protein ScmC
MQKQGTRNPAKKSRENRMTSEGNNNIRQPGSYRLKLNNNVCWRLKTGSTALRPWVRKLAGIMELEVSPDANGDRGISFITGDNGGTGHPFTRGASENGWKFLDMGAVHVRHHDDIPDVICTVKAFSDPQMKIAAMWNAIYPVYLESIKSGGLPLHAALLELDGRGVLMAAPSGTGKSTSCGRLPDHWNPLCDEETLVVVDHTGNFMAHPFPTWSCYFGKGPEKTCNVQHCLPISGVFFMEQSDADKAAPMGEGEAALSITRATSQICRKYWRNGDQTYQRAFRNNLFGNACRMAKKVPAFSLRVSRHGRFWEEIERVLGW